MTGLTQDSLVAIARMLPLKLRDEYFQRRLEIRIDIKMSRGAPPKEKNHSGRLWQPTTYVHWDDPEFVARCAVMLAELQQRAQARVNGLASG